MDKNLDINVLPEDRIKLTQDQINLIELAFISQVPSDDAQFIKKVYKNTDKAKIDKNSDAFVTLSNYYIEKYGHEFGLLYLTAILGGEELYNQTLQSMEKENAENRINNRKSMKE